MATKYWDGATWVTVDTVSGLLPPPDPADDQRILTYFDSPGMWLPGKKILMQDTTPTVDLEDGDIWFDTDGTLDQISTSDIQDLAITTAKIDDDAVTFAKLDHTAWIAPTLLNSWTNYDVSGGTWTQVAYRRVGDIVEIRGLIQGGTPPSVVFVLPSGFRPPGGPTGGTLLFTGVGDNPPVRIDVLTSGNVQVQGGNVPAGGYLSLSEISFSVTA